MGQFTITIDLGNAAFEGDELGAEVARIVREQLDDIEGSTRETLSQKSLTLKDINGNDVGFLDFDIEPEEDETEIPADLTDLLNYMSNEDILDILENMCGVQVYSSETFFCLSKLLVGEIKAGHVTQDQIREAYAPRFR